MRLRRSKPPIPPSIRLPPRWRRHATGAAAILAVLFLLVCERSVRGPIQGGDQGRYHDRAFRVVHIVDGDTLDIDAPDSDKPKTRIRLWGVDTPELARGGRREMHFAVQAREFAERTLADREVSVVLTPQRTRDRYGRLLAYVFCERGGRMFNEMLLEEGYAYADPRFAHPYKKQFEATEKRARKGDVGLWANLSPDQMPAWRQRLERASATYDANGVAAEDPPNAVAAPAAAAVGPASAAEMKEDSPSLSIKHVQGKTTTKVTISWKQKTESLLVISIESTGPHSPHIVDPWVTRLDGIVLIRRAGAEGEATVMLANELFGEFFHDHIALIKVYLAESVTFQFRGEPIEKNVKSEPRVERMEEIRPEDASPELRFVCAARDAASLSRMLPDAKPWSFDLPESNGIAVVMADSGKRAFRQIGVTFGEDAP